MPGIFISYRREDAPGHAGRLYDVLSRRFGEEQVFMDLTMEPGVDFVEHIHDAVGSCRLLIAVIGPHWTDIQDARGQRRLGDATDFITVEVEAGLKRPDVRVVPVLVQGARMPTVEELPPSLAELARRNALELSDARWEYDVSRLTSTVERVLGVRARPSEVSEQPELPDSTERAESEPAAHERLEGQRHEAEHAEPGRRFEQAETTSARDEGRQPASSSPAPRGTPDRGPRARGSWLRRPMSLAILALFVVAAATVAVIVASKGNDHTPSIPRATNPTPPSSTSRLLDAVPATIGRGCRSNEDNCCKPLKSPWMVQAVEQIECKWTEVVKNYLTYGRWSTPDKAKQVMLDLKQHRDCDSTTTKDVKRYYATRGDARCQVIEGEPEQAGVVIWWRERDSPIIGWFQAPAKEKERAAFAAWKSVVEVH